MRAYGTLGVGCMCTHLKIRFNNPDVGLFVCAHVCVIACALLVDHLFKVLLDMSSVAGKALFPPLMQHHGYLSLLQRVSVSISTLPNSRLPLGGGLAWTFSMVLAAHCALDPLGHHAVT